MNAEELRDKLRHEAAKQLRKADAAKQKAAYLAKKATALEERKEVQYMPSVEVKVRVRVRVRVRIRVRVRVRVS